MPSSASLVPNFDVIVHLVLDDFGKAGRAYRETDEAQASFESVVDDLITGQFNNPVHIVAFNSAEGWSRDVSHEWAVDVLAQVGLEKLCHRLIPLEAQDARRLPRAGTDEFSKHISVTASRPRLLFLPTERIGGDCVIGIEHKAGSALIRRVAS
jgi:hypothetical protein